MKKARRPRAALSRRRVIATAGAVAAGIVAPAVLRVRPAHAAYPERPVRIVVANSPGGPSDIVGRIVAAALQKRSGKTFIVENRGGGGGNVGMGYAAHQEPDGYTILLATDAYSVNASLYRSLPYDPLKDFVGVCALATSPLTLVVRSDLAAKTVKEFVALARAHLDKYNVATPPIGTTSWLLAQVLKLRETLPKLECVAYKGGGDALGALLGGVVQASSGSLPPAYPHIKAGTLRCLAVTGEGRWPDLPDVPTMAEAGYPGIDFANNTALLAPAGTPAEIVKWLESETLAALAMPAIEEQLHKAGFRAQRQGADAAWAHFTRDIATFKSVLDQVGINKL
jgi:tripartite-type tricarboxylate transporter receptor subunit TctC